MGVHSIAVLLVTVFSVFGAEVVVDRQNRQSIYRRLRAETPYLIDMGFLHWYTVRRSFSSGIWWYKPFLRIWFSNKVIHRKQNTLSQHIVILLGFTEVKMPYVEISYDSDSETNCWCSKPISARDRHPLLQCKNPTSQDNFWSWLRTITISVSKVGAETPYLKITSYCGCVQSSQHNFVPL